MTTRYVGVLVTLDEKLTAEEALPILEAVQMLRGVVGAEFVEDTDMIGAWATENRIRHEVAMDLFAAGQQVAQRPSERT